MFFFVAMLVTYNHFYTVISFQVQNSPCYIIILGTCQKLAVGWGRGGGDFKLSVENDVTLPSDENEIS